MGVNRLVSRNDRQCHRFPMDMNDDTVTLRARAIVAAALAAKSRDREVTKLLLLVSEQLEEEACRLDIKTGGPKLDWVAPSD